MAKDLKYKGSVGESYAARFLLAKGYKILYKNWTSRWAEIDIIAAKDDKLVFVEVKYRTTLVKGSGYDSVNFYKVASLMRAMRVFVTTHAALAEGFNIYRFDVIDIIDSGGKMVISHHENVSMREVL